MVNGGEEETIVTTIEVNKKVFLDFKALCVLKEFKLSEEIGSLIKKRVEELSKKVDFPAASQQ